MPPGTSRKAAESPFHPKGEPVQLNRRSASEAPGKQLSAFGRLTAENTSLHTQGSAGVSQSKTPNLKAPNKPKRK